MVINSVILILMYTWYQSIKIMNTMIFQFLKNKQFYQFYVVIGFGDVEPVDVFAWLCICHGCMGVHVCMMHDNRTKSMITSMA